MAVTFLLVARGSKKSPSKRVRVEKSEARQELSAGSAHCSEITSKRSNTPR